MNRANPAGQKKTEAAMTNPIRFGLVVTVALFAVAGCQNDAPTAVDPGTIPDTLANRVRRMKLLPGTGEQLGFAGRMVNSPAVFLTDSAGAPVQGIYITFKVASKGGVLEHTRVPTSNTGYASPGEWTLGPEPGINSVLASLDGVEPVVLSALAVDPGAITWYDLKAIVDCGPQQDEIADQCADAIDTAPRYPYWSESIALTENGFFGRETGQDGWWWIGGRYRSSGEEILVTSTNGPLHGYRRSDGRIWFVFCGDFAGAPGHCEGWVYSERAD
jgi:hypothetical protein